MGTSWLRKHSLFLEMLWCLLLSVEYLFRYVLIALTYINGTYIFFLFFLSLSINYINYDRAQEPQFTKLSFSHYWLEKS